MERWTAGGREGASEWSRVENDLSISFAHLDPDIFTHSSWQNCPSFVRLDEDHWWTAIFESCCRFSIKLRSDFC